MVLAYHRRATLSEQHTATTHPDIVSQATPFAVWLARLTQTPNAKRWTHPLLLHTGVSAAWPAWFSCELAGRNGFFQVWWILQHRDQVVAILVTKWMWKWARLIGPLNCSPGDHLLWSNRFLIEVKWSPTQSLKLEFKLWYIDVPSGWWLYNFNDKCSTLVHSSHRSYLVTGSRGMNNTASVAQFAHKSVLEHFFSVCWDIKAMQVGHKGLYSQALVHPRTRAWENEAN